MFNLLSLYKVEYFDKFMVLLVYEKQVLKIAKILRNSSTMSEKY